MRLALALALARLVVVPLASLPASRALAQTAVGGAQSCVGVTAGSEHYYDCLNKRLQSGVEQHRFTARDAPYSAKSPAPAVNGFNEAATRQRLGAAFGHAAGPPHPPAPVYVNPLARPK